MNPAKSSVLEGGCRPGACLPQASPFYPALSWRDLSIPTDVVMGSHVIRSLPVTFLQGCGSPGAGCTCGLPRPRGQVLEHPSAEQRRGGGEHAIPVQPLRPPGCFLAATAGRPEGGAPGEEGERPEAGLLRPPVRASQPRAAENKQVWARPELARRASKRDPGERGTSQHRELKIRETEGTSGRMGSHTRVSSCW